MLRVPPVLPGDTVAQTGFPADFIEATRAIFATRDVSQLPEVIVTAAVKVMDADAVTLLLPRADGALYVAHSSGLPPEVRQQTRIAIGEGIAGRVAETRGALILNGELGGHGRSKSAIVYPLVSADRLVGLLTFNRATSDHPYRTQDLESVSVLASFILLALENARLTRQSTMSEKLAAVGQLATGIAHEMEKPVQLIGDSVHFVRGAVDGLQGLLTKHRALCAAVTAGDLEQARTLAAEVQSLQREIEPDHLVGALPRAIDRSVEGVRRVAQIVQAVKTFGRTDQHEKSAADVNELLQTTALVAGPEYRHVAALKLELGEVPALLCHPGDLGQVFLNLIANAAQAVAETERETGEVGTITVTTATVGTDVVVSISDTGPGIPPEIQSRVFDPFFTTKARSTGLGLSIARTLVVEKHGGTLTFDTEPRRGTTFWVRLPVGL